MKAHKRKIFILLVFSLLVLFFVIFLIYPKIKTLFSLSSQIYQTKQMLSQIQEKGKIITEYEKVKAVEKEKMTFIENLLLDRELPIPFISFLEEKKREENLGMKITTSNLSPLTKSPPQFLEFHVLLEGGFDGILRFIEKLENAPFLLEVNDLKVFAVSDKNVLNCEISFFVYLK